MFVLGRQSPGAGGVASDEGFEIGRFTLLGSLGLALVTGIAGVMFAVLYSAARPALPSRARIPAATLVGGTLGGSSFLDPDGIDLLILDPLWFAVAAFIALPAAAACAIAVALERAARARPWPEAWRVSPSRGLAVTAQVAVTGFVALLIAAQGTKLIDVIGRIP